MKAEQDISEESIVISTASAISGKADFCGVLFEDIQGNVTNNRHVFGGVVFSHSAVILMKCHVKTPMQGIFNAPMGPGSLRKSENKSKCCRPQNVAENIDK